MEIPVTLHEVEAARKSVEAMKPQEVDYIATLYKAATEIAMLRRLIGRAKHGLDEHWITTEEGKEVMSLMLFHGWHDC